MPSLFQTFKYGYTKFVQPKRARIKHIACCLAVIVAIALFFEVVVFNFRAISTAFNKPIDISEKINLQKTSDGRFVVSAGQNTIELKDINQKVGCVHLAMDKSSDPQEFSVKINFTDSGHKTYFDTTDYTVGIPEVKISTTSQKTQYFTISPTGEVKDMKFIFGGKEINYPLYIKAIVINDRYPFDFVM